MQPRMLAVPPVPTSCSTLTGGSACRSRLQLSFQRCRHFLVEDTLEPLAGLRQLLIAGRIPMRHRLHQPDGSDLEALLNDFSPMIAEDELGAATSHLQQQKG